MSGGARARLFVAVDPPLAVREQLALWARTAAAARPTVAHPTLRLLDPDLLHLTLCFLGSRPVAEITAIGSTLGECAARVRGSLSGENWRAVTVLQRDFKRAETARSDARETLDSLLLSLAALAGFALDDMTQDDGWRFMMIGRRLERLQFLADLISRRLKIAQTPLRQELEWLLEIGDSSITYRTRYRAPPVWDTTIDLLVYDEKNPRALAFQWRAINTLLIEVAESLGGRPQDTLYDAVSSLVELKYAHLGDERDILQSSRRALAHRLDNIELAAGQLSEQLTSLHFSHSDFDLRAVSA